MERLSSHVAAAEARAGALRAAIWEQRDPPWERESRPAGDPDVERDPDVASAPDETTAPDHEARPRPEPESGDAEPTPRGEPCKPLSAPGAEPSPWERRQPRSESPDDARAPSHDPTAAETAPKAVPWHLRLRHPFDPARPASASPPVALPRPLPADLEQNLPTAARRSEAAANAMPVPRLAHLAAGPPDFNGRFECLRAVAAGGTGAIYQAIDRVRREAGEGAGIVALKTLHPEVGDDAELRAAVVRSAVRLQGLSHPNIVRVYDVHGSGGEIAVSMEWLGGRSLAACLDEAGERPMPWATTRLLVRGLLAGLAHAQDRGVVHGDLKPANVFIVGDGGRYADDADAGGDDDAALPDTDECVKLLDFGFGSGPTGPEPLSWTRAYSSCEVLEGEPSTPSDDVYSAACIIYRMLAGVRPWGEADALAAERAGVLPVRPRDLPAPVWRALSAGLAFRRRNRPRDAAAFAQALGLRETPRDLRPAAAVAALLLVSVPTLFIAFRELGPAAPELPAVVAAPTPLPAAPESAAAVPPVAPAVMLPPPEEAVAEGEAPPAAPVPRRRRAAPAAPAPVAPALPAVGLARERLEVPPGADVVRVPLTVTGERQEPLLLQVTVESGTALRGVDFAAVPPFEIELPAGTNGTDIYVPLLEGAGGGREFSIRIALAGGSALVEGPRSTIVLSD